MSDPGPVADPPSAWLGLGCLGVLFVHVWVPAVALRHAAERGASWRTAAAAVLVLALFWAACGVLAKWLTLRGALNMVGLAWCVVAPLGFAGFVAWHAVAAVLN